jgi:hypothetical protein
MASPGRSVDLVGSHIADLLVEEGASAFVILGNFVRGRRENLASALASGCVSILEGDIRDRERVAEAMRGIDMLFHQAAIRITPCAEEPRLALEVLVDGTFNVLEEAVKTREVIFESYPELGYNYRMTDLQAAIGREQLKRLPEECDQRAAMQFLLEQGIATRRGIMCAHREPPYAGSGERLPHSEAAQDRSILLPLFHQMTEDDQQRVALALRQAV